MNVCLCQLRHICNVQILEAFEGVVHELQTQIVAIEVCASPNPCEIRRLKLELDRFEKVCEGLRAKIRAFVLCDKGSARGSKRTHEQTIDYSLASEQNTDYSLANQSGTEQDPLLYYESFLEGYDEH